MKMVDSSGWLEYFAGTPNAENFAPAIEKPAKLLVSVINMHEVFKKIARESSETAALKAVALMQQGKVQPVTTPISLNAARIGNQHKLPLADSFTTAAPASSRSKSMS